MVLRFPGRAEASEKKGEWDEMPSLEKVVGHRGMFTMKIHIAGQMESYFTNLDFPEIYGDFPSKTLPFGGNRSCEVAS